MTAIQYAFLCIVSSICFEIVRSLTRVKALGRMLENYEGWMRGQAESAVSMRASGVADVTGFERCRHVANEVSLMSRVSLL